MSDQGFLARGGGVLELAMSVYCLGWRGRISNLGVLYGVKGHRYPL